MTPILTAANVAFEHIIRYPYIEIEEEAATFITGESGCGKSTLLRLLNGTLSPTEGIIKYCGIDTADIDALHLRKEILLVSQSVYLFEQTIRENFIQYYQYREQTVPDDDTIRLYLQLCCGDFPLDTICTTMSGGERQRVYLAIFLSFQPRVLLLDEPTAALDSKNALLMLERVKKHCRSKHITLIIVSHDLNLAARLGDHIITLDRRS